MYVNYSLVMFNFGNFMLILYINLKVEYLPPYGVPPFLKMKKSPNHFNVFFRTMSTWGGHHVNRYLHD